MMNKTKILPFVVSQEPASSYKQVPTRCIEVVSRKL